MNENIDLTKILDGCPRGTEFYHAGYGTVVWLVSIDLDSEHPIQLSLHNDGYSNIFLTKRGTNNVYYNGPCILFPSKDQRDWSKFERFWDKPKVEKVKKVERFKIKTLQPFDKVLIRNGDNLHWKADFFGYIAGQWVNCVGGGDVECVPYNEETKHLIGTTDDCPEYYKWWEE